MTNEIALGIDLGTYNSAAAVALGRDKVIMVQGRISKTMYEKGYPSFVLFDRFGEKLDVGKRAKDALADAPEYVVWGVKRLIGLSLKQAEEEGTLKRFQYKYDKGPDDGIIIKVGSKCYTPGRVLEFILEEIKKDVEDPDLNRLIAGRDEPVIVGTVVVSVPAYFKGNRVRLITNAVEKAFNLEEKQVRTIAEPTAAAIRYGVEIDQESIVLTFDLGAGTLDVTILQIVRDDSGELIPGEICTSGYEACGGIDMDDAIINWIIEKHKLERLRKDPREMALLKYGVERAKIRLSFFEKAEVELQNHPPVMLSRKELEDIIKDVVKKCRNAIRIAINKARPLGVEGNAIEHVLLVGGPTYMPCIRSMVKDELSKLGVRRQVLSEIDVTSANTQMVDPMECVAQGAALKAAKIVDPSQTVVSAGYGTMWRGYGVPDYYDKITEENSPCQLTANKSYILGDPKLEVTIPLAAKRSDDSSGSRNLPSYYYIGDYNLTVSPSASLEIDVKIEIDSERRTNVTIVQKHPHQQVYFEEIDRLDGEKVDLQEHTAPWDVRHPDPGPTERIINSDDRGPKFTRDHLERYIQAGQETIHLVKTPEHGKTADKVKKLENAIQEAVTQGSPNFNIICPRISNFTKDLLFTLRTSKQITSQEYEDYSAEQNNIASR